MPRHTTFVRVLLAGLACAATAQTSPQTAPPAGPRPKPDTIILDPIWCAGPGVGDEVHLFTKHRADTRTTLYRLDARKPDEVATLTARSGASTSAARPPVP